MVSCEAGASLPEAVKPLPPRCREKHDPLRFSYQPISGWIQEVGISILGFTHYCGKTRDGRFLLCQKTQRKRMIRKLKELRREMRGVGRTSGFGTSMRGCPRYCVGTMPTSASRETAGLLAANPARRGYLLPERPRNHDRRLAQHCRHRLCPLVELEAEMILVRRGVCLSPSMALRQAGTAGERRGGLAEQCRQAQASCRAP